MDLSYQEKTIWASLIANLLVYGRYFTAGPQASLVGTVIALVIIEIVFQSALSIAHKPEPRDERDRLIASRAYRIAYVILITGVLTILCMSGAVRPTARVLLMALVASEVGKSIARLYYYRRGV